MQLNARPRVFGNGNESLDKASPMRGWSHIIELEQWQFVCFFCVSKAGVLISQSSLPRPKFRRQTQWAFRFRARANSSSIQSTVDELMPKIKNMWSPRPSYRCGLRRLIASIEFYYPCKTLFRPSTWIRNLGATNRAPLNQAALNFFDGLRKIVWCVLYVSDLIIC